MNLEEVKLYTDIECFTREFSFIKMQYCMPYFKTNYKEEHKIYEQYEVLINKIFKKLYDYEQENKQLKENKNKAIEYFKYQLENLDFYEDTKAKMLCAMGITLLQEGDKE